MKKSTPATHKIILEDFPPVTSGRNVLERKQKLRDAIKKDLGDRRLNRARKQCRGKHLFLNVKYYLLKTTVSGSSQKDLDNLIKILFDVIPDYISQHSKTKEFEGLGLVKDDKDIFGICCEKEIVEPPRKEGLELEISIIKE
ncbi:hypothetical protein [Candidatus Nitrosotenuis sp. DW1]|uniref:hypothetical protein n=1 Tax=Candidatus Nitrosotenuis sp. DW1 TaxID=2259672 RepID=UPI0015C7B6D6|nr:hypothetical protein [Candidatus Nitrosotenuis sp. DW1]QLH09472.1 hypothetical protein DSQ19_08285 [Candidatus Nitrosotenuis sp. DW1]